MTTTPSATRVNARIDGEPSRGLWLIKWLLLVPHLVVLSLLWLAFTVLTVIAFFAIVFTARYPRAIFEFNLGVLRWTWRVWFYGYGALGTDRYPPFSLGAEPDYPATFDIAYPERLSRGLVLVKWWLLVIPHYLVVAFFVGSGFVLWRFGGGLVTVLALIAGVVLLFTGRYPRGIFDFGMGMNRWAFRTAAYAALMTDEYPPLRMDIGGANPTVADENSTRSRRTAMLAHPGDWLIVERGDSDHHARRGRIEEVRAADGSPPYVVRWIDSDRTALVFPGPDAHVLTRAELESLGVAAVDRFVAVQHEISRSTS